MATPIRFAFAWACFAASLICLALWLQSEMERTTYFLDVENGEAIFEVRDGTAALDYQEAWRFGEVWRDRENAKKLFDADVWAGGSLFARFPLWYAAIVFAVFGVGFIYLGPRFSIRSALVATTVLAALIAMAVVL